MPPIITPALNSAGTLKPGFMMTSRARSLDETQHAAGRGTRANQAARLVEVFTTQQPRPAAAVDAAMGNLKPSGRGFDEHPDGETLSSLPGRHPPGSEGRRRRPPRPPKPRSKP
jgi:hypothetical protein